MTHSTTTADADEPARRARRPSRPAAPALAARYAAHDAGSPPLVHLTAAGSHPIPAPEAYTDPRRPASRPGLQRLSPGRCGSARPLRWQRSLTATPRSDDGHRPAAAVDRLRDPSSGQPSPTPPTSGHRRRPAPATAIADQGYHAAPPRRSTPPKGLTR